MLREFTDPQFHTLFIRDLVLHVHLGCSSEERKNPQEVRLTIDFRFKEMPPGALSDRLEETICYAEVAQAI